MAEWIKIDLDWRKTVVWGSPEAIANLIARIEQTLPAGWRRNPEAEKQHQLRGGEFPSSFCFVRSVDQAEVWLWLNEPGPTRLTGGNVIPDPAISDYRKTAAETISQFRDQVLVPAAMATGVHVEENRIGLRSQVPPDVMDSLWRVVDVAPRSFPLSLNCLPKWRAFVIAARTASAAFDPDEFAIWFEAKGWARTDARLLADKFFEDAWLLSAYDEARKPA